MIPPEAAFRIRQGYEFEGYVKEYLNSLRRQDYVFQKAVQTERLIARFDVFVEDAGDGGSHIYEVKSSKYREPGSRNKTHQKNIYDLAFQVFAAREAGLNITKAFLVNVDGDYVLGDELDLEGLIKISDRTDEIEALHPVVAENIDWAFELLEGEPSDGFHDFCDLKLDCPFFRWKFPDLPDRTVCDIPRIKAEKRDKLFALGCVAIEDVPEDFGLSAKQTEFVEFYKTSETVIDKTGIAEKLAELEYPLYFLDYETVNPSIPQIKGMKPVQQITFQHSLHIKETAESESVHREFLSDGSCEAPRAVAQNLRDVIGDEGSVVVWFERFEKTRNKEMGELYPEFETFFENLNERTFDLYKIFSKGFYRDPKFKSNSIKDVLPVLVPDLSYEGMEIDQGGLASARWYDDVYKGEDEDRKLETMESLKEYCKMDTLAMVRILEALENL